MEVGFPPGKHGEKQSGHCPILEGIPSGQGQMTEPLDQTN